MTFKARIAHAFAVKPPEQAITDQEREMARRVATEIARRRLTSPAHTALESSRPYTFLGSQFLTFLSPFIHALFKPGDYQRFVSFLEKRDSVDCLIQQIERLDP